MRGKTFQLVGPAEYSYKEVAEFVGDVTTLHKNLIGVPAPVARAAGMFIEQLIAPVLTADMVSELELRLEL